MAMVLLDDSQLQALLEQAVSKAVSEVAPPVDEILDREGIAQFLKIAAKSVPKLVLRDGLPAVLIAGKYRARRSELETWLATRPRPRRSR